MLNPSTATATIDDPTITRVSGFSHSWGYGSLEVVNLFAIRTSHPAELPRSPDPVGPENDAAIIDAVSGAVRVVLAWGNGGTLRNPATGRERGEEVTTILQRLAVPVAMLGLTKQGQPRHPLYVAGSTEPMELTGE